MNVIDVGYPTLANMRTALESIGFTYNSASSSGDYEYLYYDDDGTHKAQVYVYSDNRYREVHIKAGDNSLCEIDLAASDTKLCYEELSNGGIAIGFSQNTSTPIQFAFVAPSTASDTWKVPVFDVNNAYVKVYDYETSALKNYYPVTLYQLIGETSNDIQIIALHNGVRFADNIFVTALQPELQQFDSIRAEVGNKTYLLVRLLGTRGKNCIAIEVDE